MKPHIVFCRVTLFIMLINVASCSKTELPATSQATPASTQQVAFATTIPIDEMNTLIQLEQAPRSAGSLGLNPLLTVLYVSNLSGEVIGFPYDYGTKILRYSEMNQTWTEVKNLNKYSPSWNDILLEPKGWNSVDTKPVIVLPDISHTIQPIEIRIVVQGKIYRNGLPSADEVVAYIDIVLTSDGTLVTPSPGAYPPPTTP